jgi:hypothetical protein
MEPKSKKRSFNCKCQSPDEHSKRRSAVGQLAINLAL